MSAESTLFRAEALLHQRQRLWGNLLLLTPPSTQLLTLSLLALVGIASVYLSVGDYSRRERVKGILKPVSGLVRVYAPGRGEVARLLVRPGETVRAGQLLAEVRAARRLPDGRPLEPVLAQEVAAQITRLETEQRAEREREQLDRAQLQSKHAHLDVLIAGLKDTEQSQVALVQLAARRRDSLTPLANAGQIPRTLLETAQAEWLERSQRLAGVQNERRLRDAESDALRVEAARLPLDAVQRADHLAGQLSDLRTRQAELTVGGGSMITAPVAGRLSEIYVGIGQQVTPDRPLMALSARDTQLEAVLLVPSRAIGFIAPGQSVQLRYDAFPQQRFGSFAAVVANVDDSLLLPSEVSDPIVATEPVYRVRARLRHEAVNAYGKTLPLRAGLAFEADVILDKRSLLRWLLDPLFSLRGRL